MHTAVSYPGDLPRKNPGFRRDSPVSFGGRKGTPQSWSLLRQGWGGGHEAWLYCCLLAAPIDLSPLTLALPLNPFFHSWQRPSASHHLVPFLSLPGVS